MAKTNIPKTAEIIRESMGRIRREDPTKLEPAFVRDRFSDALEAVFESTYGTYRRYEEREIDALIDGEFMSVWEGGAGTDAARAAFRRALYGAIQFEKSLRQSRSSRAGSSFETIVQELFRIIGIPSERVTKGDRRTGLSRIDLVIPDRETAVRAPDRAHFLSLKTSLRERWREVVEEQTHGQRTHLLTILQKGERLSDEVARRITRYGIFLYVPDHVKDDRFAGEPRVRRLSDLPASVAPYGPRLK